MVAFMALTFVVELVAKYFVAGMAWVVVIAVFAIEMEVAHNRNCC
jgi:hypothetical protein